MVYAHPTFAPLSTAQTRLFTAETVRGDYVISVISVQVRSEGEMASAMTDITEVLRERHRVEPGEVDDVNVINQADLLSTVASITGVLTTFLGVIAAISLLVGPAVNLQTSVTASTMLLAAGFSAAVGLFFGIYPAMRAAGLHPIDALRLMGTTNALYFQPARWMGWSWNTMG